MKPELIAPCGMNCGLCVKYLAARHGIRKKGIAFCGGCRPDNKSCAYLKKRCGKLSGNQVRFCFECGKFPCGRLQHLDRRYRTFFHTGLVENLLFLRDKGMAGFLAAQHKKWKCPACGDALCCHNGVCFGCGVGRLKRRKQWLRWKEPGRA